MNDIEASMPRLPHMDHAFGYDRLLSRYWDATARLTVATARLQQQLLATWWRAAWTFPSTPGEEGSSVVEAWFSHADGALVGLQRSPEFLDIQRECLQAQAEVRTAERAMAEVALEQLGLPTPTDFDDVARTVSELRREVRALNRRLDRERFPAESAA